MDEHRRLHAWKNVECDCPHILAKEWKGTCQACKGKGVRVVTAVVPKKNAKVIVTNMESLREIFNEGIPEWTDEPATVFDVQTQEEHHLELRTGIGVRITWDQLTKYGLIPKDATINLWTFDLMDLKIVTVV